MEKERLQTTSLILIASIVVTLLFLYDEFYVNTIEFATKEGYEVNVDKDADVNEVEVETDTELDTGEEVTEENSQDIGEANTGLIDINKASKDELMEVDGIGDVLSQRILDYISENGEISVMEELENVSGIGEVLLGRICEKFFVE